MAMVSDQNLQTTKTSVRDIRIDVLKGIAIIAVAFYHFGGNWMNFGFLGVDVFFVISGYFMMLGIKKKLEANTFSYVNYIIQRVCRLLPLILIILFLSLSLGYFTMLPDDLENLGESVVASNFFANNILACITTRNYWDIVNMYKPLMHLWYVGVLMQAYIVFPIIFKGVYKLSRKNMKFVFCCVFLLFILSLFAYLLPFSGTAEKFYYLPYRAFELLAGSILVFIPSKRQSDNGESILVKATNYSCILFILLLLIVDSIHFPLWVKLISVVILSSILIFNFRRTSLPPSLPPSPCGIFHKILGKIGEASYSVYIMHQVIIAFMFYAITDKHSFSHLAIFSVVTFIVSSLMYKYVEKPLGSYSKKHGHLIFYGSLICGVFLSMIGGGLYLNSGIVRDVPELNIKKGFYGRGQHGKYGDRPYAWNRDFGNTEKKKSFNTWR